MHLSKCSRCGEHLVANFWKKGKSGVLPRVEMAEYEPHVMRAGGGGKLGVRLSADRFRFLGDRFFVGPMHR